MKHSINNLHKIKKTKKTIKVLIIIKLSISRKRYIYDKESAMRMSLARYNELA